jgi:hypothetical protein
LARQFTEKNLLYQIDDFGRLEAKHFVGFSFEKVDFMGEFNDEYLAFTDCQFTNCAFYKCTWKNVKFQKCVFNKTSFSIARFENCQFRDCTFEKISISGNEMKFFNTYIEPYKFISAAYTNIDPKVLKEQNVDPKHQAYRLEGTKSSAARMLLQMRPIRNKIDTFMEAKHIARKCESFSHIKKGYYDFQCRDSIWSGLRGLLSLPLYYIEYLFILAVGWLSGWGLKIGRTFLIGFLVTIGFAFYYNYFLFETDSFIKNYLKSLEYWFLFGYTKYDLKNVTFPNQLIIFLNSLLGLFWFGTILPVLLEKMGKDNE